MTLKYSSSDLALAKRDWALDFWVRNVSWAFTALMVGGKNPLEQSQLRIRVSVNLDCSSNFDHHFTLNVLCRMKLLFYLIGL